MGNIPLTPLADKSAANVFPGKGIGHMVTMAALVFSHPALLCLNKAAPE